jgi:hypothetical protein
MITHLALGYIILINLVNFIIASMVNQDRHTYTGRQACLIASLNLTEALAIFGLWWPQRESVIYTIIAILFWLYELVMVMYVIRIIGQTVIYAKRRGLWAALASFIVIALASVLAFG